MKKLLLLLMFSIVLVGVVSASITYRQGDTIELTTVCNNCTYVNLTKAEFPNGSIILLGQFSMTKNGTNFNYTFSNTRTLGTYKYVTCGDLDGTLTCEDTDERIFEITYFGKALSTAQSIIYLISLIVLLFLFVLVLVGAYQIPSGNNRSDNGQILSINNLKYVKPILYGLAYVLVMVIMFVSSNLSFAFLGENMFGKLFFTFYIIMFRFMFLLPFIWIIWLFAKIAQDKEIKNMIERGVPVWNRP